MTQLTLIIGNKRYSSWSLRAWLAMRIAGLDFEEVVIPLRDPDTYINMAEYATKAPLMVPMLHINDLEVWDSLAIMEYAAEHAPAHTFWPEDAQTRAWARSVTLEMHSSYADMRNEVPMDLFAPSITAPLSEGAKKNINRVLTVWKDCRTAHKDMGPFLFGTLSMADLVYSPVIARLRSNMDILKDNGITLNPVHTDYIEAMWSHPEYVAFQKEAAEEPWVIEF